jgi:hypothetical protein
VKSWAEFIDDQPKHWPVTGQEFNKPIITIAIAGVFARHRN